MIIGNNFNNPDQNFGKNKIPKQKFVGNNNNLTQNSLLTRDLSSFKYSDPTNTDEMNDKALAMLQERLQNNTISLDEFNKQCNNIAKRRR